MASSVAELYEEASGLDARERATLAGLLLESIGQEPDPESDEAWKSEIERRIKEIDSVASTLISWEDVKSKLFRTTGDES